MISDEGRKRDPKHVVEEGAVRDGEEKKGKVQVQDPTPRDGDPGEQGFKCRAKSGRQDCRLKGRVINSSKTSLTHDFFSINVSQASRKILSV